MTPAAARLDRTTAPLRDAVLAWARARHLGFSSGYRAAESAWRIEVLLRHRPEPLCVTVAETGATVTVRCGDREEVLRAPTPRKVANAMGRVGGER